MKILKPILSLMILVCSFQSEANNIIDTELECLAKNIYFEARGEKVEGRIAVGYVTLNRVTSKQFPNTICGVVKQARYSSWWKETHNREVPIRNKCQFSWYCDGLADEITDEESWIKAVALAKSIILGQFVDVTSGATHYHSKGVDPWWNEHYNEVAIIGNHIFFAML